MWENPRQTVGFGFDTNDNVILITYVGKNKQRIPSSTHHSAYGEFVAK